MQSPRSGLARPFLHGRKLTTTAALLFPLLAYAQTATINVTLDGGPVLASTCDTPLVLPDILIRETQAGSLAAGTHIRLGSSYGSFTRFDLSYATLSVTRTDTGAVVEADAAALQTDGTASADDIPDFGFQIPATATSTGSPRQWRLRGVLAQVNGSGNPASGESLTLRIGRSDGTSVRNAAQIQPFTAADGSTSDALRVATRVQASCPTWPYLQIGPITARQIVVPAHAFPVSSPAVTRYIPFVAAHIDQHWYALTPQRQWQAFTGCHDITAALPAQSTSMPAIPLLPTATDLSQLSGTELWIGWGQATSGSTTTEQACQNIWQDGMLNQLFTLP